MGDRLSPFPRYVEVALQARMARLGRTLTYALPDGVEVGLGQVVWAPLRDGAVVGIVTRTDAPPPIMVARPLLAVLSDGPLVASWQLELATWLAARYACGVAETLSGFLPPPARAAPRLWLNATPARLTAEGRGGAALLQAFGRRRSLDLAAAARAAGIPLLAQLLRAGLVCPVPLEQPRAALPLPSVPLPPAVAQLTAAQAEAFAVIRAAIQRGESESFLLHGVTGSGKTHVYLHAARETIARGRQVVMLVNDISLALPAERRLDEWFPGRVAVVHSERSPAEQRESWERIASGEARVVVGARSALFAPFRDVGLLVVDEEHETAYKQSDRAPSYHARELALQLGKLMRVPVVLGSATPDIATYQRARQGEHRLLELPRRYAVPTGAGAPGANAASGLPRVQIVDLRA